MGSIDTLKICNPEMHNRFKDYKSLSIKELDDYAEIMKEEFVEGKESRKKWPRVMYSCSKLWTNLWTSSLGREIATFGYPGI